MKLVLAIRVLSALWFAIRVTLAVSLSKPGCQEMCGHVTIPYPFGIGEKCSANSSFTVICQNSTKPFLRSMNLEVLDISLHGVVRVNLLVSPTKCSDGPTTDFVAIPALEGSPFTISPHYNSLVVMGCGNVVWLCTNETLVSGCMALCDANSTDTSCDGINCCTAIIPSRMQELQYTYQSFHPSNSSFCGFVFPAEAIWLRTEGAYEMFKGFLNDLSISDREFGFVPLILEWEFFGTQTNFTVISIINGDCYEVADFGDYYSYETHYASSMGYCSCYLGFEGNPYIVEGCSDIDECRNVTLSDCPDSCVNTNGSYSCGDTYNPDGFYYDHNDGFRAKIKIASIVIGSVVGLVILISAAWKFGKAATETINAIIASRKHMFFKRNGGLLLEQQLAAFENGLETTKLYSSTELAKATDDYNENRILGRGGEGVVYKGMLEDGRIVAVKKSERVKQGGDVEDFINEIVIVSQINHRNVVKLLGCCLESEFPRIVYEFIPNGTLFSHIHHPHEDFPLFWELRVRIAKQVAGALAYLHSAASVPIYHRDIKSTNILLDEKYRAKISDFGTSRSISLDQTHVTTRVVGTFGYLDPEYFQSSQFTEKSDVYSFGVVLVELITGEKAVSAVRVEEGRGLAMHFLHSMEKNQLFDIIDARVLREGTREDILAMAEIAKRCLHLNGKGRPTMKEVARDLDAIQVEKQESDYTENQMESSGCNSDEDVGSDDFSSVSEIIELSVL